jgi:1,4-alpha-glucan branching enzyme
MIKKRKLANNKYNVTFSMPTLAGVTELYLVGDFNEWNQTSTPLKQEADGTWSVKLTLEANKEYQYRYLDNKGDWHNDWEPDAYIRNSYGSDNSLVSLVNGLTETPARKVAARKRKVL